MSRPNDARPNDTWPNDTWTTTHDLALVYVALAYGTDHDLSDEETAAITERLMHWSGSDAEAMRETMMEALAIYLEAGADEEVARSVHQLAATLSGDERRRALEDVVRIAEADGLLLSSEQSLIATLAETWKVKATEKRLIDQTTATVEERTAWSLLHDLGLLYIVLAHSADDELSDAEITAMINRVQEWQPELSEEEARQVLREALAVYGEKQPDEETLRGSVQAIRDALPTIQRLVVLDDLAYIANADGHYDENERAMIASLAQAWKVSVRMDGQAK